MKILESDYLVTHGYPVMVFEPLDGKPWQEVLDRGCQVLDDCQHEWQLGSGTLLGIVREEDGYIHHDTDLDLDIIIRDPQFAKSKREETIERFEAAGFKLGRTQSHNGLPMQLAFICAETSIIFDLCFFYNCWGDGDIYYNVYQHGVFIRPAHSVNSVARFSFNNGNYNIPKNYSRYLNGRFGADWRVPKTFKTGGAKTAANYLIIL